MTATPKQIGMIHALKKAAALDDDSYRGVLGQVAGVRSAKDLSVEAAIRVIDRLKVLSGQAEPASKAPRGDRDGASKPAAGALRITGPFAAKFRALWISGWNLGVVADRTDTALAAFVARQTRLDSPSWLTDPAEARRVIEALKSWIAREADLAWPKPGAPAIEAKRAVVRAQWRRLIAAGAPVLHTPEGDLVAWLAAVTRGGPKRAATLESFSEAELDKAAPILGAKLRAEMKRRAA